MQLSQGATDAYAQHRVCAWTSKTCLPRDKVHVTAGSSGRLPDRRLEYSRQIQGDSGGIFNTLGNDTTCDFKQKSLYQHGSDFERLPRYGKKKIPPWISVYGDDWKGEVFRTKVDTRTDLVARINNTCGRIKDRRHELRRATSSTLQRVRKCIEVGGVIFENLLWDVPDVDKPGFCPLRIISNTMVSTCMHVMLVVMLFIT